MKLIIASPHCTKLDLIEFQYKSIKKYVLDEDYEYFIFNDGSNIKNMTNFYDDTIREKIELKCKELNIKHIPIPQELHTNRNIIFPNTEWSTSDHPSWRASIAVQYIYNYFKNENCKLVIIESDMLFINYINLNEYMNDVNIKFLQQSKTNIIYMWIGILLMDLDKMQNKDTLFFDCGKINNINVDSGGYSYYYLNEHPELYQKKHNVEYHLLNKIENFDEKKFTPEFFTLCNDINVFYEGEGIFGETYLNECLYHIRAYGSNWNYGSKYFKNYLLNNSQDINIEWEKKGVYWKKYMELLSSIFSKYINSIN